jgi:glucose/arabinose dehydrogenase
MCGTRLSEHFGAQSHPAAGRQPNCEPVNGHYNGKRMNLRVSLSSAALAVAVAALFAASDPKLPPPFHSPSVNNRPRVIEKPQGASLNLPTGFTVELWAEDFARARLMLEGPGGEVLLSDAVTDGAVWLLVDTNNDFKPDSRRKLIGGLDRPYGMAFWKEYLYVAETTSVKRYKYDTKAMTVGQGEEIVPMHEFGRGHWTRCILFNRAGDKLYLGIGSASNVEAGEPPMRAAINRFNPDGSGHEIYASGTRNPTSIRWYPDTDTLWAAVQERDALGDDLVPDFLTSIKPGGFYGWPFAYVGRNEDPRRKGEKPDLVKKTIVPDVLLGSHVAVLDLLFYTGKQFPAEYQGGAFVALHGSWNRSKRVGQSVAFVPFKDGRPAGPVRDFLTGWMLGPDQQEVWGRPVGLMQMRDGSLLVSEDGNNKVYRVTYRK